MNSLQETTVISRKGRIFVIGAAMLALFLGALDALIVGSAMPTILSDLGGLHLYGWVFSSYMLARAVSLPIFGKLCDLMSNRNLYIAAIVVFIASSTLAGAARSMEELIVFRSLQGIGAGGTFALAYIVVSDFSPPGKRAKMMGLISSVWGIASILGPAAGGFIVAWFSWRWIFYINIPIALPALIGIALFLKETREKKRGASIDYLGAFTLTVSVLALLAAFLLAGRAYPWLSVEVVGLFVTALIAGAAFYAVEKRAPEPILNPSFFGNSRFSLANGSAFFSSFAIFSLSAFTPLLIQGGLGRTPAELGVAMVPLSLAWSAGALLCGQTISGGSEKSYSVAGSIVLCASGALMLTFSPETSVKMCSAALAAAGIGMGLVSVSTLLVVQNSLQASDLGVATSSQQFARTLGGTIGVGVSGNFVTAGLADTLNDLTRSVPGEGVVGPLPTDSMQTVERLFQPEIQAMLPESVRFGLREGVFNAVGTVFWTVLAVSLLSLILCVFLPRSAGEPTARRMSGDRDAPGK